MKKPLISIVTPSFNQGEFIEETIVSVLSQDYPRIEYLVMDGGSTDNTVQILKKYNNKISWLSEIDEGQADAVNKGFSKAQGDILGWVNSDDTFNEGAFKTAVDIFLSDPNIVMVYGDAYFIDKKSVVVGKYPTEPVSLPRLADTCYMCQPSVFIRKDVLNAIGLLDADLQTCMDYDYWIRIFKQYSPERVKYLEGNFFSNSRIYSENKTYNLRGKVYRESMRTQKKHFGKISRMWIKGYIKEIIFGIRAKA